MDPGLKAVVTESNVAGVPSMAPYQCGNGYVLTAKHFVHIFSFDVEAQGSSSEGTWC